MLTIESEKRTIDAAAVHIFNYITDFRHFGNLLPADKVSNWESDKENCSFEVNGVGRLTLRIARKQPWSFVEIAGGGKVDFGMHIALETVGEKHTQAQIVLSADLNPFVQMLARRPLEAFVNDLATKMTEIQYPVS